MSKRKKRRRRSRKRARSARGPQTQHAAEVSPQARALGRQFIDLPSDQFIERLERGMLGAVALRHEPEFEDFYFDDDHVLEATNRHLERYQARFGAMSEDDVEATRQLYDEMRIDIIADLVTPEVRRDLQERADRCLDRLKRGRDTGKMEMALYASGLLAGMDQTLPLGLCGLFTAIYEDSRQRAMKVYEAQQTLGDKIAGWLPRGGKLDVEQVLALAQQPEVVAQFTETLEAYPELRANLEKDIDQVISEVGQAIRRGELPVDFFTDEEIILSYADLYNALGEMVEQRKTLDQETIAHKFLELMRRNLVELVTSERNQQFRQRLEAIAQEMVRSDDRKRQEMGMKLSIAASTMDTWEPGQHPFLYDAYFYQAEQMQKQRLTGGASPEQETQFRQLLAERGAKRS